MIIHRRATASNKNRGRRKNGKMTCTYACTGGRVPGFRLWRLQCVVRNVQSSVPQCTESRELTVMIELQYCRSVRYCTVHDLASASVNNERGPHCCVLPNFGRCHPIGANKRWQTHSRSMAAATFSILNRAPPLQKRRGKWREPEKVACTTQYLG